MEHQKTYEDVYDVIVKGRYNGTIKVVADACIDAIIKRFEHIIKKCNVDGVMISSTQLQYGKDYKFKFIGKFSVHEIKQTLDF